MNRNNTTKTIETTGTCHTGLNNNSESTIDLTSIENVFTTLELILDRIKCPYGKDYLEEFRMMTVGVYSDPVSVLDLVEIIEIHLKRYKVCGTIEDFLQMWFSAHVRREKDDPILWKPKYK